MNRAADNQRANASPAFFAVVLDGPSDLGRGFLAGFELGAGEAAPLFLDTELSAGSGALRGKLKAVFGRHGCCQAVMAAALAARLQQLAGRLPEEVGLELAECRPVREARFSFRYRAYARKYSEEIRALLAGLPAGVRREGGDPVEHVDKQAKGVEVYSPAHDYEARGEGEIVGPVDLVVAARRQLAAHPLVETEAVELTLD